MSVISRVAEVAVRAATEALAGNGGGHFFLVRTIRIPGGRLVRLTIAVRSEFVREEITWRR